MQPENPLYNKHDVDELASDALRAESLRERADSLLNALSSPDKTISVRVSDYHSDTTMDKRLMKYLNTALRRGGGSGNQLILFPHNTSDMRRDAEIGLYDAHDSTEDDRVPGLEITTSVVSADLYPAEGRDGLEPKGKVVLLRLGVRGEERPLDELEIGVDCRFGAMVFKDGRISPFELAKLEDRRQVIQSMERDDPTDESGKRVDAEIIQHSNQVGIEVRELDPDEDAELYNAVMDELDLFVSKRLDTAN